MRWSAERTQEATVARGTFDIDARAPYRPESISGFSILEAASGEAVTRLLDGHPHLEMPGASIAVLEFLPTPGA